MVWILGAWAPNMNGSKLVQRNTSILKTLVSVGRLGRVSIQTYPKTELIGIYGPTEPFGDPFCVYRPIGRDQWRFDRRFVSASGCWSVWGPWAMSVWYRSLCQKKKTRPCRCGHGGFYSHRTMWGPRGWNLGQRPRGSLSAPKSPWRWGSRTGNWRVGGLQTSRAFQVGELWRNLSRIYPDHLMRC